MTPFWKRKDDKVRIQQAVPSFFASIGDEAAVCDPKEARAELEKRQPCAAVIGASPIILSDARSWANALSSAAYLVVIGDPDDPECRRLMKIIDGIIFSPVPRRLSSAFIVRTREEAAALIDGVKETFPSVITFRVSEGKEKP